MKQYVKAEVTVQILDEIHDTLIDMQDCVHDFTLLIDKYRKLSEGMDDTDEYLEAVNDDLYEIDKLPGTSSSLVDKLWNDIEYAIDYAK